MSPKDPSSKITPLTTPHKITNSPAGPARAQALAIIQASNERARRIHSGEARIVVYREGTHGVYSIRTVDMS